MSDDPAAETITSELLKAHRLAGNSIVFPQLVEAACWEARIPYTGEVLQWCATRPGIVKALTIPAEGDVDADIRSRLGATPTEVDAAIRAAVTQYTQKGNS